VIAISSRFSVKSWPAFWLVAGLLAVGSALVPRPAHAQPPAPSVTERLIELLVQKGVLPRDQATALLQQAQQEAHDAPSRLVPHRSAPSEPPSPASNSASAASAPSNPPVAASATQVVPPGTVRVPYVPQIVRDQIAEQVRSDVMKQAKAEGWAQANVLPEWIQRLTVFGDVRLRGESDLFPRNTLSGQPSRIPDYQTINAGSGFDINSGALPPLLDSNADRERMRLRARIGVDAQIDDGVMAELRIATGNDASPVSANQTLGQNGDFDKYALWLDRAFIQAKPASWLAVTGGRGPNPFWTTDLMYYDDLGFDGVSAAGRWPVGNKLTGFVTAGAFPVMNTSFNFATTQSPKESSRDSWLFAAQGGAEWQIARDYAAKFAVGYFDYSNIQGKLSAPCTLTYSSDACSTDDTRPLFLQFGNTMFPIRNILPNATSTTGGSMPQYFGLASQFGVLDLHGRFDINRFNPVSIALDADFATNLAFNRAAIIGHGPTGDNFNGTKYAGGPNAYLARVTLGHPVIAQRWDWSVSLAYKRVESDAVLAALTDPDFHLGGTNAKGFILGGNLGIARNTFLTAKWMSANEIVGPPYAVDVLQFDLNVRF
jgi:hypothetical protein